jgi:acyl phosphate:glycerol-3-phosphate acyltransferase
MIGTEVAGVGMTGAAASAVAAVAGNCWSIFLGFRGGKGVATGLGALLLLVKLAIVPAAIVFAVVAYTTRFVSLGSLLAAVGVPIAALALGYPRAAVLASAVIALIIVGRHHENIGRLINGTESRVGERVKNA